MRRHFLILLVAVSLGQAAPALATVAFTANDSALQASAFASVGSPFAFQLDGPRTMEFSETGIPSTFGGSLSASAMVSDNDGPSTAEMTSSINVSITNAGGGAVSVLMDIDYQTNAQASPGGAGDDFDNANAEGSALIQLSFDIDTDYFFSFTVFGAAAMGSPDLEIMLRDPDSPDPIDVSISNSTEDLFFSGMLEAGSDYEIVINVDDSNNVGAVDGGSAIGMAGFTNAELILTPVVVPVPAAIYLLVPALAWLSLFRRRT